MRPTKLTDELQKQLVDLIRAGNYIETASSCAGISKNTLYDWLKRGAREKNRTDGKRNKKEQIYVNFSDAVEKATAEAEARDVMIIGNASKTDWKASAWRLERKFPTKWGRKDSLQADIKSEHTERTENIEIQIEKQLENDPQTTDLVRQLYRRQQAMSEEQ